MLHLYDVSRFQEWYQATNHLFKSDYLETNEPLHHFVPFSVNVSATSHYYLYNSLESGLCGSVELARLANSRVIDNRIIPQGTWIVKNSYFYLPEEHPYSRDTQRYEGLIQDFYQQIFAKVCTLSARDQLSFVLTYHQYTHTDFATFGEFTFVKEWVESDWIEDKEARMGLLSLQDQVHNRSFSARAREKMTPSIVPFPLSSVSKPYGLTSLSGGLTIA